MKLTAMSSLGRVAACVAGALARSRIRAVLTGGACASLYTGGQYQSSDLDFVLQSAATRRDLDAAMGAAGFRRAENRYEHPEAPFFVEFPAGPLGIGTDIDIRPVGYTLHGVTIRVLSPTDSCRDRLAAFYHWKDRQSLRTAVQIARRRRIDLETIRRWSEQEGSRDGFSEFVRLLKRTPGKSTRARRRRSGR